MALFPANSGNSDNDTGWQTINANLKYRIKGDIVYVYVVHNGTATAWTTIGQLPTGARPSQDLYDCAFAFTSTSGGTTVVQTVSFYVSSNGNVQSVSPTNAGTIGQMFSYPLG